MEIICYGCGRGENPENTLEAFLHCLRVNPEWRIEMDVRITSDHQLVLFHDDNTLRTTGKNLLIHQLTLKETQSLNAGYHFNINGHHPYRKTPTPIPALSAIFRARPKARLLLDIHTNHPKVVTALQNLIDTEFEGGDFVIASKYDDLIKKLKVLRPNWQYGVPKKAAQKLIYSSRIHLDQLFPITSDVLMIPEQYGPLKVLSKRIIEHAHKRQKKVWAWKYEGQSVETFNSAKEWVAMNQKGIDGIFTEYPQKLYSEITK